MKVKGGFLWVFFVGGFVLLIVAGFIMVRFYSYVFAKSVTGEIVRVERVNSPGTFIAPGQNVPASQIFSFAIAIRGKDGEIHTASSEDRQWAVVQQGQCAEAKFYPYPFWQLDKSGTYHGARLMRLFECNPEERK